ncbi:TPA: hypothetical protein JBB06_11455 [Legionella pneumophila subsp. pneumophila]|uniref:PhoP regulatory network protein YrbL n=1 Tax=Legionella pneumophila (strain Lens) TaxID=297245 RepID=Q5WSL1_LEGPL|nr:YrbL family protein [Legionella pneumophila]AOW53317.1 hypothetical protein BE841_13035 [Legionella pneumophila subsp. pneumophila]AOW55785.1 hypothetical protein BE842_10600 [Legionella pneumophila subsp. pneumophila]AOW58653.1 hypothetical protein BE843_10495 [Legionella pneumophila subsp. pneumophila]AOW61161.1 hypothetical protein BE844_08270 [Legionella pneumophila subsp. pneumophila]AOW64115.1 hypothetical protein BE845_08610 [Legionella pneumophila subsp. pneumophila]
MIRKNRLDYIYLNESHFLFEGQQRLVYKHPLNADYLIKISKLVMNKWGSVDYISYRNRYRFLKYFLIELREHARLRLQYTPGQVPYIFQKIIGFTDTNLGMGLIVQTEKDKYGHYAPTCESLLKNSLINEMILQHLEEFLQHLLESDICIYDLTPSNIVYSYTTEIGHHFVLIDGFGDKRFIPLSFYSKRIRRYQRNKAINKFRNEIQLS